MSKRRFIPCLLAVAVAHVGLLICIGSFSGCSILNTEQAEVTVPVEFLVEAPAAPAAPAEPDPVPVPREVEPPEPEPEPVKPAPRLKRADEIKVSRRRVDRTGKRTKPERKLSPEEIKRRLAMGARPSDRTTAVPEEEARCLLLIRETLYSAWRQPSAADAGGVIVKAELTFQGNGHIVGRRLSTASGNPLMDASVMQALNSVKRIDGLTAAFLERHHFKIVVAFKVE